MYQKGDKPYTTMEFNTNLVALWKIPSMDIVYIDRGFYLVFLINVDYQSMVMSMGM